MSLEDFRKSFIKFASDNGIDLPDILTNANEAVLIAGINTHLRPFANNLDLCYSNLQTLIMAAGHEMPELNEEQTAKVKRYLEAFIKCTA